MAPIRLRDLGALSVTTGEPGSGTLVTQPRLLALLAYLVVARPHGQHSRDTLIALLWPEADQASGRQALRNALHRLRLALGEGAILSVGENFVTVAPGTITSDALEFERAVSDGRWQDAVTSFNAPFLNGFHVDGAVDFALWLDNERSRLTMMAVNAAHSAIEERIVAADMAGAIRTAALACELSPDDERSLRRYLQLLMDAGDHAAARRVYGVFAERQRAEYDADPSPETRAVLDRAAETASAKRDSRQAPRGTHETSPVATVSTRQSENFRRSRFGVIASGLALLLAGVVWWRPADSTDPAADTAAIAAGLDGRWGADTALLQRYLRGRSQIVNRKVREARETFTTLTHDAPHYAPGWAGLAVAELHAGFTLMPPRDAIPKAIAAARQAMALDTSLSMAHEALVGIEMWGTWDMKRTKSRLDIALVLHPGDEPLLNMLATWHRWRGEFDVSLSIKHANAASEPLSARYSYQVMSSLFFAHRCREAVDTYRRYPPEIREAAADGPLLASLLCAGERDDVATELRSRATAQRDSTVLSLFVEPLTPARRDSAIEATFRIRLDRLHAIRRTAWVPPDAFMVNYALRQHEDSTLLWLDEMFAERSMMLYVVPFDPLMDFLRANPRFDAFLNRLPWINDLPGSQHHIIDSLRHVSHRR